jgi:monofunctional biosynthetic peptidoglycan transglycosylase
VARASVGRVVGLVLLALVALFVLVQSYFAAMILWYRFQPPRETAFMAQRLEELRAKDPKATLRYTWVPYARISTPLKRAVIAAEDAKFVEHGGFDWEGIAKAREKNDRKGRVVAGGSTITQQLAKNLFLSPAKSYLRKGQEAIITAMMEAMLPKQRILELYLNVIEWGNGVFGAEAAARRYYNAPAASLGAEASARPRVDDPVAAPLRAQPGLRVPGRPRRDDPRADAFRRDP